MFGQLIHGWVTSVLLLFDQYTTADQISLMLFSQVDKEEVTKLRF